MKTHAFPEESGLSESKSLENKAIRASMESRATYESPDLYNFRIGTVNSFDLTTTEKGVQVPTK